MAHSTHHSFLSVNQFNEALSAHCCGSKLLRCKPKSETINRVLAFSKALEVSKSPKKTVSYVLN